MDGQSLKIIAYVMIAIMVLHQQNRRHNMVRNYVPYIFLNLQQDVIATLIILYFLLFMKVNEVERRSTSVYF